MKHAVKVIETDSEQYPKLLKGSAFGRLYSMGNFDIMQQPLLGFFCATRCPGDVILRTYDLAKALRKERMAVISGFHTPVEKDCRDILLKGNQAVVICPARGIVNMRLPKDLADPLDTGRLLILSPFGEGCKSPTTVLAARRNLFVAHLSQSILIAYAPPESKTEQLGLECLRQAKRVYLYDVRVNERLLQVGGIKLALDDIKSAMVHEQT